MTRSTWTCAHLRVGRVALALAGLALPVALVVPLTPAHAATSICVGADAGCQPTLAAALAVAQDGDTVQLGPGTFPGGIVIERSITLAGAGADQTTIKGGGPVIEVGRLFAPDTGQRVRIEGVTVTGGFTRTFPGRQEAPAIAAGGGIRIPWTADFGPGADVTVVDSVVTGNRVSPVESIVPPPEDVPCPGDGCPFAVAFGGGVAAWGPLHLVRTAVTDNRAGSAAAADDVTSSVQGGGIRVGSGGSLAMEDSTVSGNVAAVRAPNGRYAEGGGIEARSASIDVTGSRITGNQADVRANVADDPAYPPAGSTYAYAGGVDSVSADHVRITRSTVAGNLARGVNLGGTSIASGGGLVADGSTLSLRRSVVSGNQVVSGSPGSPFDVLADTGGVEIVNAADGAPTVSESAVTGNVVRAVSRTGDVDVSGGGVWTFQGDAEAPSLTGATVSGNRVLASTSGRLGLSGAGIFSSGDLALLRTKVTGNTADVRGGTGTARGGGVYAAAADSADGGFSASRGSVSGNVIRFRGGLSAGGGGIFAEVAVMLSDTPVVRNSPDPQCEGCDGSEDSTQTQARRAQSVVPHPQAAGYSRRVPVWSTRYVDPDGSRHR